MGELSVAKFTDQRSVREFMRAILADIRVLELMIEQGAIEENVRRMGVEQEMFLVSRGGLAAPVAAQMMDSLKTDRRFQFEVARFNLEANLDVQNLHGSFLCDLEAGLNDVLTTARSVAAGFDADVLLTGILPSLRHSDVTVGNLTPLLRYQLLNEASLASHNGALSLKINGIETFEAQFDSIVIEGANTSLQLHFQVGADESAEKYNLAQLITAPLLAVATNAPVLLGKRVWCETRVAVFERSFDDRSASQQGRKVPTRVGFGSDWVKSSLVELFRDNAARYQLLLTRELPEDPMQTYRRGEIPKLSALQLHNGTVWRWNRPCYGITNGKPHLRIENRVLPGGPTVLDEVANAALFYGLMLRAGDEYADIASRLPFADAKANFIGSAHNGLDVTYHWLDGRRISARDLLLKELLPLAREGLASVNVPAAESDRYLDIIEERTRTGRTGATWLLDALAGVAERDRPQATMAAVQTMLARQQDNIPVHRWQAADAPAPVRGDDVPRTVADIMTTDVFTVGPADVVDLATSVMSWKHIRHVPVEDAHGKLVGLLTTRELLRLQEQAVADRNDLPCAATVMNASPPCVPPDTGLRTGMRLLLERGNGCLLIVRDDLLVGIVTERDFVRAAYTVLTGNFSDQ